MNGFGKLMCTMLVAFSFLMTYIIILWGSVDQHKAAGELLPGLYTVSSVFMGAIFGGNFVKAKFGASSYQTGTTEQSKQDVEKEEIAG